MPTLTQLPLQGDLVKYVLEPNFNYESVTLLTGTNYLLGAVLGLITEYECRWSNGSRYSGLS